MKENNSDTKKLNDYDHQAEVTNIASFGHSLNVGPTVGHSLEAGPTDGNRTPMTLTINEYDECLKI